MAPPAITIQYSSLRSEVWTQYSRLWRQKLWRVHAMLFAIVAIALLIGLKDAPLAPAEIGAIAIVGGLIPCVGYALYPLVKFKPQTRVLTIDDRGLTTSIGELYGEVPWREVAEIADHKGLVIIRRTNGNAFVVPDRAFASASDRVEFVDTARAAWAPLKP